MITYHEERLGFLLRILRPAPRGWVEAAQELPAARRTMDEIVARADADAEFQAALVADLETALAQEGYEPSRPLLDELDDAFAVREALAELSEPCQEMLDRFFARDESYKTISRELDLPAGTIASRISRCLRRLREELEGKK